MQLFHASRVIVLVAGLGVASTTFAGFSAGNESVPGGETRIDFASVLANAQPGQSFDSSFTITNNAGEETGVVRLAGTISPVGIVNFAVTVVNVTDAPTSYGFLFGGAPFDVTDPIGRAYSVASVLDLNGDGASMEGDHEGGAIVEYGYIPGPDASVVPIFDAQLLSTIVAGPLSTASASDESSPAPGFLPIAGRVITLNASVKFVLSGRDQATVQGAFMVLVPAPGAGMLGLAGLAAAARRRRSI